MENKSRKHFIITGALFLLFILFTIMVKCVDVQPIGPEQSVVGFASLNELVLKQSGMNLVWYNITDWLGVIAIMFAAGFAVLGFCQLVKRRSLLKVDYHILLLGIFYVVIIFIYLIFEFAVINYRPVILHTELEASYPSSHTMIVVCIMGTAMMQFHRIFYKSRSWLVFLDCFSVLLAAVTVAGRLISGVHWFTDIVGGMILSGALLMLYYSAAFYVEERKKQFRIR